jgi:copper(I)-binding protein
LSKIRTYALVALLLLPAVGAHADDYQVGSLTISKVWSRPTAGQTPNGAVYMSIANKGRASDRLVSVEADAAGKAELHTTVADRDVMQMRPVPSIDVGPGKTVELKPGGLHVMLLGLKAPLTAGKTFPVVLKFEKAGTTTVQVTVQRGAAPVGAAAGHPAMHAMPKTN